ncbi:MAG: ParB/RepB/Spo0J family partition protein [Patescibacteria group bacterium]
MKHLGRGLGALISDSNTFQDKNQNNKENIFEISIEKIKINSEQPRQNFDPEAIEELANSILEHGILQPLIITNSKEQGFYELIAGERRLRAAKIIGLKIVPVRIREAGELEKAQLALVENIQRQDLNPVEEAQAYQKLINKFNLTQEEVSKKIGKNRATIANILRVLTLPEEIQNALILNKISLGHAKIILGLNNLKEQMKLFKKIIQDELSVRVTENIRKTNKQIKKSIIKDPNLEAKEENLREVLETKVEILPQKRGGRIIIEYYSEEELNEIIKKINN